MSNKTLTNVTLETLKQTIEDAQQDDISFNDTGLKIRNGSGDFVHFVGISKMGIQQLYNVTFTDGTILRVTANHGFFTTDGRDILTKELCEGLELLAIGSTFKIVKSIVKELKEQTYDVIETDDNNYYTNGVLSHNCEFLSSDALLIDSLFLVNLGTKIAGMRPKFIAKEVTFWDEIKKDGTYLIGVDPATGSGEDFSVITIFEFPALVQVGEYRSNTMSTNDLYGILKNIIAYLETKRAMVYFSVENNGVGEGVISLYEADEKPSLTAEFVSEEGVKKRGMTTTSRSKMKACVNLKELMEKNHLHIVSPILYAELKTYIRTRGSYAAQLGSTDDCISAVLIIIRLIEEIATYDQNAFDKLYAGQYEMWKDDEWDGFDDYDENDEGMPIVV